MDKHLPAPFKKRYDYIILKDSYGVEFELNRKNYYDNSSIFFKDMSFNRWDDIWTILRKQTVFLLETQGLVPTVVLYDLRENLEYAEKCLSKGISVKEAMSTKIYCMDLLSKLFCYVIIDGQNRETMNKDWYEGKLYITKYQGYVRNKSTDVLVDIPRLEYPTNYPKPRYTNYYIPGYKQMKQSRGDRIYPYQEELLEQNFLNAVDNCIIPVDMFTQAFRSQMSDIYESYNLKENNTPLEIRNALQGELSHWKRSLFFDSKFEDRFPETDFDKMLKFRKFFDDKGVDPRDSYYTHTSMTDTRYAGYLLFEDETQFLDNSLLVKGANDPVYRELYSKFQNKLPKHFSLHNKLILERAKLCNAYSPKQAGLSVGKSINFDLFTFLNDLYNPTKMFEDMKVSASYLLTDEQKSIMTDDEIENFKIKIKIINYESFMKWIVDDCLIEEMDNHKVVNKEKIWETETKYFTHLRDNKNWILRRKFYRGHFLISLPILMNKKIIKVTDALRVTSDKQFRDILRQQGGKDSRGNVVESMIQLKQKYNKSHTYPHSWGIDENGLTIGNWTSIFTKVENQKVGAKVHV